MAAGKDLPRFCVREPCCLVSLPLESQFVRFVYVGVQALGCSDRLKPVIRQAGSAAEGRVSYPTLESHLVLAEFAMSRRNCRVSAGVVVVLVCLFTLTGVAGDEGSLWQTKFEDAKAKAKAEKKLLLVDFTGSDWCGWCIKLKQEVFDRRRSRRRPRSSSCLVELDFPRQKQLPEELKAQNDKLAKQYKVRGFPTILVLDAEGQLIARTGYRPGGPEEYVKHLTEFVTVHESIVQMRAELANVRASTAPSSWTN